MKFVMFPSGILCFSLVLGHDFFRTVFVEDKAEDAVAAGFCEFLVDGSQLVDLELTGYSTKLGLSSSTVYSNWREKLSRNYKNIKYKNLGILNGNVFFLAFKEVSKLDIILATDFESTTPGFLVSELCAEM